MATESFLQHFVQQLAILDAASTDSPRSPQGLQRQTQADFCLRLLTGDAAATHLDLSGKTHVDIGRQLENGFVVKDPTCSRRHCRLTCDDGAWFVEDLLSRNGTYVNGVKIFGEYLLCNGDEIQIGNTKFQFTEIPLTDV